MVSTKSFPLKMWITLL